jgi:hypothetical protein
MRLLLGAATLANPALTNDWTVRALKQKGVEPRDIVLVCNSDRVKAACQAWEKQGVTVHYPEANMGTCASWNYILEKAWERRYEGALIFNDDVLFNDDLVMEKMLERVTQFDRFLYMVQNLGFSGFCITRTVWDLVGRFDEGFWPAYFEDNDYHWRAKAAGIPWVDVNMDVAHLGSASLKKWKEWEDWNAKIVFVINRMRYVEKWGGHPSGERFTEAWGGKPERAWNTKEWLRTHGHKPPWPDPYFERVKT